MRRTAVHGGEGDPCTILVGMRAGKACKLSRFSAIRGGLKMRHPGVIYSAYRVLREFRMVRCVHHIVDELLHGGCLIPSRL